MITSIDVHRFRGIESGSLKDLPRIAVLLGPNGSGKSTFLEALLLATAKNIGAQLTDLDKRRGDIVDARRWVHFLGKPGTTASIGVVWDAKGPRERTVQLTLNGIDVVPDRMDELLPELRFVDQGSGAEREKLHRVYSEARVRGGIDWAKGLVREVDPEIRDFEILTARDSPELFIHYEKRSVPAVLAGDGMASLVRICLEMSARTQGTVLIEEPEAHQHTASVVRTARAIVAGAKRGCQVIMSTHSMELLDAMLLDLEDAEIDLLAVYRVRMSDGKTRVLRMNGADVAASRAEIADDLR